MAVQATLYLHIGLPKTATTYLQREIFPALTNIRYLGTPRNHNLFHAPFDLEHGQRTFTSCVNRSVALWGDRGEEVFQALFGESLPGGYPGSCLLSDEGIGRAGSRPFLLAAHLEKIVGQAHAWGFRRVKFIGSFRRQDHWLASHYAQVSDRNSQASQEDFEEFLRETVDQCRSRHRFGMLLDYAALSAHIDRIVGKDNLLLVPFELLKRDPRAFHNDIASFLGAYLPQEAVKGRLGGNRHNARSRSEDLWQLRPSRRSYVCRLRPAKLFKALRLPDEVRLIRSSAGETIRLTREISSSVLGAYEPSNRALASRLGLDLSAYGYFPADAGVGAAVNSRMHERISSDGGMTEAGR